MVLKNLITSKTVCTDLKICESFKDRMFGLLIKSNPRSLFFKTRFGIHTFFLKEPVDVLILDERMKVRKIKQNLKPNQLFFWNPLYSIVIELSRGTVKKFCIKQGQVFHIS
jgi:uncharacterized protein